MYVTDVYVDAVTGGSVVTISKAIIKNGALLGVVGVYLNIENIKEIISNTTMGQTGKINLMDSKGIVIAHRNEELIGKNLLENTEIWNTIVSEKSGITDTDILGKKIEYPLIPQKRRIGKY